MKRTALVAGAGGFIGHHMVNFLKARDYDVRGVDIKEPEYEPTAADDFRILDLRRREECIEATRDMERFISSPRTWAGSVSYPATMPMSQATTS